MNIDPSLDALFHRFFAKAPAAVDIDAIRRDWLSLAPGFDVENRQIPLPVWARYGLSQSGEDAWQSLQADLVPGASPRGFCIYIHIPFCENKCSFCDCYSFQLRRNAPAHRSAYTAALRTEIAAWAGLGGLAGRPVSTVHLGGGTPLFLGVDALAELAADLRRHFAIDYRTEWAHETTTSEYTPAAAARMGELGFTRIHFGVQTLSDPIRVLIGRREPAQAVLDKICQALAAGQIVSVDLIFGLPGQTLASFLADIQTLAQAGVHGFSLYELQSSPQNQHFTRQTVLGQAHRKFSSYLYFQAGARRLASLGYQQNLFNHFALPSDQNLYFTFPTRQENCLAIGTIADGVFGDFHYRHPEYLPYRQAVRPDYPGLSGGRRRSPAESLIFPLESQILSTHLEEAEFFRRLGPDAAQALIDPWRAAHLVEPGHLAGEMRLSPSGSWFAGEMMTQLAAAVGLKKPVN